MKAANTVVLNTGVLYGRMLLTVGVSLYSTRLILAELGDVDFGIFNLIAGIIAMLSFLNGAMAISTQRFLSFFQGQNNLPQQKKVFTNSVVLHIIIGVIVVICLELAGLFIFDHLLNIPNQRQASAKVVYHFMAITVFFTIVVVPFVGSLIAHENMLWVAFVSIFETFLKLGVALSLSLFSHEKLITYACLTAGISVSSCILYVIYCLKKYPECSLGKLSQIDLTLFKELASFAGWNLVGALCGVIKDQGFAVLLNIFIGATINAAYGIATQLSAQMTFFSSTMQRVLTPQIMKSEGAGDRERMLRLSMMASKFAFFLLAFVAIPSIFEMDSLLKLWLQNVPKFTGIFCILILISMMINQITIGLQAAFQATGKIRAYQIIVGAIVIANIPVSYLLLRMKFPVYFPLISFALIEMLACCVRVVLLKHIAGLSIKQFTSRVLLKELIPLVTLISTCFLITTFIHINFRFILTATLSVAVFAISIYLTGLCSDEKEILNRLVLNIKQKLSTKRSLQTHLQ